jgi:hypothetical protein
VSLRVASISFIALLAALTLGGCQVVQFPTPSSSPSATGGSGGDGDANANGDEVDTSGVEGAEASGDLVDPCSLLTVDEVEAATGVKVLKVVRGEVHADGSQLCAYAMDAAGASETAMAGQPGFPAGGLGDVINTLEAGTAAIGVQLSAQDPDTDLGDSDPDDAPPPNLTTEKIDLGKGAVATATPNGGAAFAANETNVLLTIMDLIAGPASIDTLKTLLVTAYGRL